MLAGYEALIDAQSNELADLQARLRAAEATQRDAANALRQMCGQGDTA